VSSFQSKQVGSWDRRSPALLVALVLLASCGEPDPPALTVGPVAFTADQLLGLSDSRRDALVGLTALGLAVADSTTAELGAPQIAEWEDDRLVDILAADLTLEKNGVGDDVLEARYELDPSWELTVRHFLVFSERWRSDEHRTAARAKAVRGLAMLQAGQDFPAVEAALAAEGGADAREGTLPPGREGAWVSEFWAAASALEPGQISPVTETQYGFHVLRLEDRRRVPFAEARSTVARAVAGGIENPRAVLDAWASTAGDDVASRRSAAVAEARARGLTISAADRAELSLRWETQIVSWSAALGFAWGLSPAEVGRAALSALARPGQLADIARGELTGYAELLRARYPVTAGTP
jgi:hypothetical protein